MRWKGRRESSNVEDRRGRGRPGAGGFGRQGSPIRIPMGGRMGGGGLTGIILLVIGFFVLRAIGIDPLQLLGTDTPGTQVTQQRPADDERTRFVSVVLAETEDVWNGIFQASGQTYREPILVLFDQQVDSACGFASAASGPFYCPGDSRLYIDLRFFDELASRFGASGEFAQAYVVAHEVGHHVQNLVGVLPRFAQMRQGMDEAAVNEMSVRVELQADCFAGIWAHFTQQKGLLEEGDIEDALNAAHQIGDDTIQRRTQGYVVPESFSHGTSQQRMDWFSKGLASGRLDDCDTFNNPV